MSIDAASPDSARVPSKRPNKAHVPSACINCKKAHLACDLNRPCTRCITMNKVDTCHDVQQKKRGRPKLRDKEAQMASSASSTEAVKSFHISLGSKSNFSMTKSAQTPCEGSQKTTVITMFLSMEICCARASDEVLELLGYYPQEMAHRPLYGFVSVNDGERLARIHRLLLDNISDVAIKINPSHQRAPLPPTERTSSDDFFQYSPDQMSIIANGSQTLSELLHLKKDSGDTECFQAQFYLGGGWGADLFKPSTLNKLYVVATFTRLGKNMAPTSSTSTAVAPVKSTPPTTPPVASNQSTTSTGQILLAPAIAPHPSSMHAAQTQSAETPTIEKSNSSAHSSPRGVLSHTSASPHQSPVLNQVDEISFDGLEETSGLDENTTLNENTELVMSEDLADEHNIPISQAESMGPTLSPSNDRSPKFHSSATPKFTPWPVTFPLVHSATRTSVNPYSIVSARYNRPLPMNVHVAPFTHPHDAYYMQMSSSLMNSEAAAHQNRFSRRMGTIADVKSHEAINATDLETRDMQSTGGPMTPGNGVKNSQQMSVDALLS
ncbi:hypothetical protein Unana1_02536 [Umbelopsis nana]